MGRTVHAVTCVVVLGLTAQSAKAADMMSIEGTVAYRERMALPPGAKVEVKLLDVSRADAPARTIAETTVEPSTQPPIGYRLDYKPSDIEAGKSYAVQARITLDGRLIFISQTRHPALESGQNRIDIMVSRVSANATPMGKWLAEDIRSGGVIDRLQSVVEITDDGKAFGSGGCNRFTGNVEIDDARIEFGRLAATMMACAPAAMDQERKFFDALAAARSWTVDPARRKLILADESGTVILVLAAH